MVVVGAGSLAVGDSELPMGEHRQFNIVHIDPEKNAVTVYVRAMTSSGVFAPSFRQDFGGSSSIELPLPSRPLTHNTAKPSRDLADRLLTALGRGDYQTTIELAEKMGTADPIARKALVQALEALGNDQRLVTLLDPPANSSEMAKLLAIQTKMHRWDDAENTLASAPVPIDASLAQSIRGKIAIGRTLEHK